MRSGIELRVKETQVHIKYNAKQRGQSEQAREQARESEVRGSNGGKISKPTKSTG